MLYTDVGRLTPHQRRRQRLAREVPVHSTALAAHGELRAVARGRVLVYGLTVVLGSN